MRLKLRRIRIPVSHLEDGKVDVQPPSVERFLFWLDPPACGAVGRFRDNELALTLAYPEELEQRRQRAYLTHNHVGGMQ